MQSAIMKSILTLSLLILFLGLSAQIIDRDPSKWVTGTGYMNTRTIGAGVQGSPLLFDSLVSSDWYFNNQSAKRDILMDYDIQLRKLVISYNHRLYDFSLNNIDSVVIQGHVIGNVLISSKHVPGVEGEDQLLQVLFRGEHFTLVREFEINVISPTYNELMNVGSRDYVLSRKEKYLLKSDSNYVQIKPTKSFFKKMDTSGEVKRLLAHEYLDFGNESTIVRLMKILDDSVSKN